MVESNVFAYAVGTEDTDAPLVPAMLVGDDLAPPVAPTQMTISSHGSSNPSPIRNVEPLQIDGSGMVTTNDDQPSVHNNNNNNTGTDNTDATTTSTPMSSSGRQNRVVVGAGVAIGLVGMALGGPILACVAGLGTAYAAKQSGAVGDVARAVGDVALTAKAKAQELNDKHHIVERTADATKNVVETAKELDQSHKILERTKNAVLYGWTSLVKANRKHRLLDKTVDAVGSGLAHAAQAIVWSTKTVVSSAVNRTKDNKSRVTTDAPVIIEYNAMDVDSMNEETLEAMFGPLPPPAPTMPLPTPMPSAPLEEDLDLFENLQHVTIR